MLIGKKHGWDIPERLATPEALVVGRRMVLGGVAAAAIASPARAQFSSLFGGGARGLRDDRIRDGERGDREREQDEAFHLHGPA